MEIEKHLTRIRQLESEINDYKSRLGNVDQSLAGRLKEAERKISDYEKELN